MKHTPSERTKQLESRRLKAGQLFSQGKSQRWVAHHFSVSRVAAHTWYWAWKKEGMKGLRARGRTGAPPKLTKKKLLQVERALLKGPLVYGYETELWTLARIAAVTKRVSGVKYHPGHVWKILKDLGWSVQKPETRARERDEQKIKQWIQKGFPRIQKKGSKMVLT